MTGSGIWSNAESHGPTAINSHAESHEMAVEISEKSRYFNWGRCVRTTKRRDNTSRRSRVAMSASYSLRPSESTSS